MTVYPGAVRSLLSVVLALILAACTAPAPSPTYPAADGWLLDASTGTFYCPQAAPGDAIPACAR